jgi:uncharacterized protein involved in exopolysaccharide biosynthesis
MNEPLETSEEVSLLDLLQVIADHLRWLILAPIAVFALTLGAGFLVTPSYTATVRFLPPQQQQSSAASMLASLGSLGGLAGGALGSIKNPTDQYVAFLKSNSLRDPLIARFDLVKRYDALLRADVREALSVRVRIVSTKDGLVTVEVDDTSPTMAADIANAHVEELQKLLGRLAVTEAQQKRVFFEKQLHQTQERLVQAEVALKATGISSNVLKTSPQLAVESVAKMKAAVTAQEIKTASMRGYLAESAPDFKQAMNELGILRQQLARLDQDETRMNTTPTASDYVSKFREFKYQETLFELFTKQFELAKLDESREGAVIQVLDPAQVPEKPSSPHKLKWSFSAALITGLFLLVICFVRQAFRQSQSGADQAKWQAIGQTFRRAFGLR